MFSKIALLTLSLLFTALPQVKACGEEGFTADNRGFTPFISWEMDCQSVKPGVAKVNFNYTWSSCRDMQTVTIDITGRPAMVFKRGLVFNEQGPKDYEDQLLSKEKGEKRQVWLGRKGAKKAQALMALVHTPQNDITTEQRGDQFLLKSFRGLLRVKGVEIEIQCRNRISDPN